MNKITTVEKYPYVDSYWPLCLSWRRTSFKSLLFSESKLLNYLKNKWNLVFVPITKNTQYLRTLIANKCENLENASFYEEKVPIVLVHGMGAGIGLWCKNIDSISNHRKLYAMDLLGFGFSSRPKFPKDPAQVENVFTESLEEWRKSLGIDKFILLGHSLGGYLAYSYALKHPENVRHLILADPWGFAKYDQDNNSFIRKNLLVRTLVYIVNAMNPLSIVRFAGPLGPSLIQKSRPDLAHFFEGDENLKESENNYSVESGDVFDYIYHCNAQYPSGEMAFKSLCLNIGWAHNPMVDRAAELDKEVPISFIYGEKSWMSKYPGFEFYEKRPDSYVDIQIIDNCGHHIYAQDSDDFNKKINEICQKVDSNSDKPNDPECEKRYHLLKN